VDLDEVDGGMCADHGLESRLYCGRHQALKK
jgi:hypothetical protein